MQNRPASISDLWDKKLSPNTKDAADRTNAALYGVNNKSDIMKSDNSENKGDVDSKGDKDEP